MGKRKTKKDKRNKKKRYTSSGSSSEEEWVEKEVVPHNYLKKSGKSSEPDRTSSSSDEFYKKGKSLKTAEHSKKYCESDSSDSYSNKKSSKQGSLSKLQGRCNKSSSSDDSSNSDDGSYKEKSLQKNLSKNDRHTDVTKHPEKNCNKGNPEYKRDEWMGMTGAFATISNHNRRKEKEEKKRIERESTIYDPSKCERELNPYWKDGGDGLPSFKKPTECEDYSNDKYSIYKSKDNYKNRMSSWRKKSESDSIRQLPPTDGRSPGSSRGTEEPFNNRYHNRSSGRKKNVETTNSKQVAILEKTCTDVTSNVSNKTAGEPTDKDLNALAAKLVKAEIMGNSELINELKQKLEHARSLAMKPAAETEEIILTHTDSKGQSLPLKPTEDYGEPSHKKRKRVNTHRDGQRIKYFADDDKYSLKQMFEREKYNTAENQDRDFVRMAGKILKNDDIDDIFSDNIRKEESSTKMESRNRDRAIRDHQTLSKSLDNCPRCIQSEKMQKHLMVSMNDTAYLAIPPHEPLREGHCLIIPIRHVPCTTQLDENEWTDVRNIQKALISMFKSKNEEVVFFESAKHLHRYPHMCIECIPLPEGEMTSMYFKKAIDESEMEWAQNKKLVSLNNRDVRRAIPKGLPYFAVNFSMDEGFAHVIEDERLFPDNFAQEVIGGMLDLHHSKWRKPKMQSFEEQSKTVTDFSKKWSYFDCTN